MTDRSMTAFARIRRVQRFGRADDISTDIRARGLVFFIRGSFWPPREHEVLASVMAAADPFCVAAETALVSEEAKAP